MGKLGIERGRLARHVQGMDKMLFAQLLGTILAANLATVWFVYCAYTISRADREGLEPPLYAYAGMFFVLLFCGVGVWLVAF